MIILSKHKRKGKNGFIKFIRFLETISPLKVKNIVSMALLEDPVYMQAILHNIRNFQYINDLSKQEIETLINSLTNSVTTLVFALHHEPFEQEFINKVPHDIKKKYTEEASYNKQILIDQTLSCQNLILENLHKLEDDKKIISSNFKHPSHQILTGTHFPNVSNGEFKLFYPDNKTVALLGPMEKKLRTGMWKHFYPNSNLMAEGIYLDGEKIGKWKFFYITGDLKSEGEFKEDLKHGKWSEYSPEGKIKIVIYKRGRPKAHI